MEQGPTTGAEEVRRREWHASPSLALAIRAFAFLLPLISAWFVVHLLSGTFYRPDGVRGLLLWIAQAAVVGFIVSKTVERLARRLLPLAALFSMSLVFPDQAPSRFSVALKSSTVKQLRRRLAGTSTDGLGDSEHVAATQAIVLVNAIGQHDRLTRGHTERVRAYADMIAEELGMSADDRAHLAWGPCSTMSARSRFLRGTNKNGRPTNEEWSELRAHPGASVALLAPLSDWLGDWLLAAPQHHERWDGTGHPSG
ncbi:MAG: HD domain-containing phosphohydrolase [Acidimicrobiales bacterium]